MMSRGSLLFLRSVGQRSRSPGQGARNSVKKPFTNASRGAFRVQRTLVIILSYYKAKMNYTYGKSLI